MTETVDICIFGATGFTGRLICEFIAESKKELFNDVKFGIAGRNRQALEAVVSDVTRFDFETLISDYFYLSRPKQILIFFLSTRIDSAKR